MTGWPDDSDAVLQLRLVHSGGEFYNAADGYTGSMRRVILIPYSVSIYSYTSTTQSLEL